MTSAKLQRRGCRQIERLGEGKRVDCVRHHLLRRPAPVDRCEYPGAGREPGHIARNLGHDAGNVGARREGQRRLALVFSGDDDLGRIAHPGGLDADAHCPGP